MLSNKTFQVDVVTPARSIYSNRVTYLNVKAWDGYIGILALHAPLLEQLGIGELRLTEPDGAEVVFGVSGGFMEVGPEKTVVLADAAERISDIDVERARAALERAQARLQGTMETPSYDPTRAEAALHRALNRLRLVGAPVPSR